jgi:hypothetical protein
VDGIKAFAIQGQQFARGVAACLVTAGQWFEFVPLDPSAERYEIRVTDNGTRFLPVGCFAAQVRMLGDGAGQGDS